MPRNTNYGVPLEQFPPIAHASPFGRSRCTNYSEGTSGTRRPQVKSHANAWRAAAGVGTCFVGREGRERLARIPEFLNSDQQALPIPGADPRGIPDDTGHDARVNGISLLGATLVPKVAPRKRRRKFGCRFGSRGGEPTLRHPGFPFLRKWKVAHGPPTDNGSSYLRRRVRNDR